MKNGNAIVGNFSERRGNLEKGTLGCPMFIEEWPWKIHLCLILWLSISKGKPWLCSYQIASQVLILYFWAMPSVELQEQLQSLCFCSAQTIPFKTPSFSHSLLLPWALLEYRDVLRFPTLSCLKSWNYQVLSRETFLSNHCSFAYWLFGVLTEFWGNISVLQTHWNYLGEWKEEF